MIDEDSLPDRHIDERVIPYLRLWGAAFVEKVRAFAEERANGISNGPWHFWLFDDTDDTPGSFIWLCALLGYDVTRTRDKVLANWRKIYRGARECDKKCS